MYPKVSPYSDAEGSSQIISCIHDAIINADPIIGLGIDKLEFFIQCPPRIVIHIFPTITTT